MSVPFLDDAGPQHPAAWVARRHITAWSGYQPAGRYWLFQSLFAAILLAFTSAAGCACVWLAGRRR